MPRPATSAAAAIALSAACLTAAPARAQFVELYGTFSPTHLSNVQTGVLLTSSGYQNQTTSFFSPAFGGGLTVNFLNLRVVKLGFDLRGSTRPGTTGLDTGLFGVRLSITPPLLRIRPYVQASGGYLAARTTNVTVSSGGGTFTNQYAVYEILGGVDTALLPHLDYRILEVGFGKGVSTGQYDPTLFTVATGVVLRF